MSHASLSKRLRKDVECAPWVVEEVKRLEDAYLRARQALKARVPANVNYTPGNLDRTAPEKIWLQINIDGDNSDRDEPWPGADVVTWQDEPIGGLEIQYVRADSCGAQVPEVTIDMVREVEHLCPTDRPHMDKLRWKVAKLNEMLAAAPKPEASRPLCSVCGEPQFDSRSGTTCPNGHGGVPSKS